MSFILRLRPKTPPNTPPAPVVRVHLDADFYDLPSLVDMLDDAIYHEVTVTLLTAAQEAFELDPHNYAAMAVLEG